MRSETKDSVFNTEGSTFSTFPNDSIRFKNSQNICWSAAELELLCKHQNQSYCPLQTLWKQQNFIIDEGF